MKEDVEIRIVNVSDKASVAKGPLKPKLRLEKQKIGFIRKPRRRYKEGDKYINFYDV